VAKILLFSPSRKRGLCSSRSPEQATRSSGKAAWLPELRVACSGLRNASSDFRQISDKSLIPKDLIDRIQKRE
jgi:hypothetical protein